MLRFYFDEDIRHALLHAMRVRGLDVLSTVDAARRGQSDHDQLAFATAELRVLVTRNVGDFAALHRAWVESGNHHAGIVAVSRQRFATGEYADALARLSEQFTPEAAADRMEYLSNWLRA